MQNLLGLAAALAAANATADASWRHLEPQAPRPVEPNDFRIAADGGLWLLGIDGIRRADAAGATIAQLASPPPQDAVADAKLTRDGGAVVKLTNGCQLTRVDAQLHVRWTRQLMGACVIAPASDDAVWVANYDGELVKLGADGGTVRQIAIAHVVPILAAMPDGGVAVVASSGSPLVSTLTRYGSDGAQLWSLTRDGAYFSQFAASADGTLTVAGVADGIIVLRFGANGTPLSQYQAPRDPTRSEGDIVLRLAPDGSAAVMSNYYSAGTMQVVYRFGADGQLAWRKEACADSSNSYMPPQAMLPLAGGETALACNNDGQGARYLRFDASGALAVDTPLPTLTAKLDLRTDGTLQALGYAPGTLAMRLYAIDRSGLPVAAPMPLAPEPLALADQAFTDDGASYLLSRSALRADPQRLTLTKIDANGAVAWRRTLAAIAPLARVSVAGGNACVAQSRTNSSPWPSGFPGPVSPPRPAPVSILCVASGDGTDRWTRDYATDGAQHWFGALRDGTFAHLFSQGTTHTIVHHDAAGNEIARVERVGYALSGAIDAAGDIAAGVSDSATRRRVVRYDAQGAAHSSEVETTSGFEVIGAAAGQAQAFVGTTLGREYRWYRADGTLAWSLPPSGLFASPVPDRTGESVYLAERSSLSTSGHPVARVVRLRAADGNVVWTGAPFVLAPVERLRGHIAADSSIGQVVLAHATPDRVQAVRFDARDGTLLGEQNAACGGYCGPPDAAGIDAQGLVRLALPVTPTGSAGATSALVGLRDTQAQPAVRLDQIGLRGAWWAPYANGEGFVADWLPAERTWFMPWFTFSRDGYGGRSALRWYTVAGTIASGATQADLPILETNGGTFDTGGGTTVRRIGTATLRFTDCDNGTLRYVFDAPHNDGATGTITLSRLSVATDDCTLADGTVQSRAVAPANGFDARMSGSWFEEATAGQGLQFAVDPRGVFFAPWFTYDPAGGADNDGRQRWYTLQGSLAGAANGRVEVPIVETTGGKFDSRPATRMAVVGKATVTMQGCDRATLDYAFDAAAGDLAGRTGAIDLIKAGGCTP